MRIFTIATAFALGSLAMSAQVVPPSSMKVEPGSAKMTRMSDTEKERDARKGFRNMAAKKNVPVKRNIAGPGTDDKVIDETPEGDLRVFSKNGYYYSYNWLYGLSYGSLDGTVSRVVTSPDESKLYIQNPISYFFDAEENWIVGEIKGDEVTFTFPQLVCHTVYDYGDDDIEEYYDYALKFEYDEEEEWYMPAEDQTYTMRILPDGSLEATDPAAMIGQGCWFDNEEGGYWSWQGNGDFITTMSEVTDVAAEVPSDVEMETWALVSGISTRDVKIGIKDDTIYFAGAYTGLPSAVVTGTIDGDKATFKSGQFMGITWSLLSTLYFVTGHIETGENEDGTYTQLVKEDEMVFDYDADKKILSCSGKAFFISSIPDRIYYFNYVENPYICVPSQNPDVKALQNPVITYFWDYDEEYDYYPEIEFNFPIVDADKQPLEKSKLYYQVIVDGEVYEFYDDEYELPEGETIMTDVPFGYNSDSIGFYASGINHDVVIYSVGFDTLGIRTLYKDGDKTLYSDIVWVDEYSPTDAVDATFAETGKVSVKYFDLSGCLVEKPANGIFIRQTVYEDGNVKTQKIHAR